MTAAAPASNTQASNLSQLRVFYVGPNYGNSGSRLEGMRKCCAEAASLSTDAFRQASRWQQWIEWRLLDGPATRRLNRDILTEAVRFEPDIVWTEKGRLIFESTLAKIRSRTGARLVNSYSDDFLNPRMHSRHYDRSIKHYDHIFTPREQNFDELKQLGARSVSKFWKGFDPLLHHPVDLTPEERVTYEADVVFIGHAEPDRIETMAALARRSIKLKVWGGQWERYKLPPELDGCVAMRGAEGTEYVKALCGGKIVIHMLSKFNRDTQSSKSFEIPACGVFMLAQRTGDHQACYEEDREAAFFSSTDELIAKVNRYLGDDARRRQIAAAGRNRCLRSGYSNHDRIRQMLQLASTLQDRR